MFKKQRLFRGSGAGGKLRKPLNISDYGECCIVAQKKKNLPVVCITKGKEKQIQAVKNTACTKRVSNSDGQRLRVNGCECLM